MEARDFRNLTEAYYQVYEQQLDEGLRLKVAKAALTRTRNLPVGNPLRRTLSATTQQLVAIEADKKREKREKAERRRLQSASNQNESYDLYDLILSHLLDEGYAETPEAAEVMMVNMSEEWIDSILDEEYLYEMRREDKEAGKKKTPLLIPSKRSTIQKDSEGNWKKQTPMVGNPKVSSGRYRQGAQGGFVYGYQRHAHGGAHGGMERGSERGKKQVKGIKPGINTRNVGGKKQVIVGPKAPETPVERFKAQRQDNQSTNYSKMFRDYNTPKPTRLDVLKRRREARQKES